MKYLVFDEGSYEEMSKITQKELAIHTEERKKGNIPKHVVADHVLHGDLPQFTQNYRVFKIYETDDPKQLANIEALWGAMDLKTWKRWVIPISDSAGFDESFNQYRKKLKT
jgi:hypothetical protein